MKLLLMSQNTIWTSRDPEFLFWLQTYLVSNLGKKNLIFQVQFKWLMNLELRMG